MDDAVSGLGKEVPPIRKHVEIYFFTLGRNASDAESFYRFYDQRNWKYRGKLINNWKELAWYWIYIKSIDPICLH